MITQSSVLGFQNPRGYKVKSELLQEFERALDPQNPQSSRIPCHVLGYGEISTVFEIQVEGLYKLAFKRMCCFETLDEVKPYLDTYLVYNQVLENQIGLNLPPYGHALFISDNGRPVFYIIQERLPSASIGNRALQFLLAQQIIGLFRLILHELNKVWIFNQNHTDCQIGIDGQISNWAIEDFDTRHPCIAPYTRLLYLDTSTPLLREKGVERLNPELYLRSAPPYLVWILRILFLQDVITRYYDPRKVTIDLIANFYKEQRPELIPDLVAAANDFIDGEGAGLGLKPLTEKEVSVYYREDKVIWRLYLGMRRFDRWMRTKILRRNYPYILPSNVKR